MTKKAKKAKMKKQKKKNKKPIPRRGWGGDPDSFSLWNQLPTRPLLAGERPGRSGWGGDAQREGAEKSGSSVAKEKKGGCLSKQKWGEGRKLEVVSLPSTITTTTTSTTMKDRPYLPLRVPSGLLGEGGKKKKKNGSAVGRGNDSQ